MPLLAPRNMVASWLDRSVDRSRTVKIPCGKPRYHAFSASAISRSRAALNSDGLGVLFSHWIPPNPCVCFGSAKTEPAMQLYMKAGSIAFTKWPNVWPQSNWSLLLGNGIRLRCFQSHNNSVDNVAGGVLLMVSRIIRAYCSRLVTDVTDTELALRHASVVTIICESEDWLIGCMNPPRSLIDRILSTVHPPCRDRSPNRTQHRLRRCRRQTPTFALFSASS